jgi:flagellar hook-associated protein 1 FlgK
VGGAEVLRSTANTSGAVLAATRTDATALTSDNYEVRYDGGTWSVKRVGSGESVAFTVGGGGELQFEGLSVTVGGTPSVGDQFLLRPSGGAIIGLSVQVRDPSRVAAAAPIRTAAGSGNSGSVTISAGEVLDAANPALRDPVTIEFTGPNAWQALDASNTVIASGAYTPGADIDINGWRVQVSGPAATGDRFTVGSNAAGVGDNRNALKLSAVLSQGLLAGGTESLDAAAARIVGNIGVATNGATASLDANRIIYEDSVAAADSVAGVNLDEEAANLLRYQQAYQAMAQTIRVAQTVFDSIIASVSR